MYSLKLFTSTEISVPRTSCWSFLSKPQREMEVEKGLRAKSWCPLCWRAWGVGDRGQSSSLVSRRMSLSAEPFLLLLNTSSNPLFHQGARNQCRFLTSKRDLLVPTSLDFCSDKMWHCKSFWKRAWPRERAHQMWDTFVSLWLVTSLPPRNTSGGFFGSWFVLLFNEKLKYNRVENPEEKCGLSLPGNVCKASGESLQCYDLIFQNFFPIWIFFRIVFMKGR